VLRALIVANINKSSIFERPLTDYRTAAERSRCQHTSFSKFAKKERPTAQPYQAGSSARVVYFWSKETKLGKALGFIHLL
jgi:hypothetical protein